MTWLVTIILKHSCHAEPDVIVWKIRMLGRMKQIDTEYTNIAVLYSS